MATEGDGFQREHRVEPAPRGQSQLPARATRAIVVGLLLFAVIVIVVLFVTGGLSFAPRT
jgi:hypothetical protein